MRQSYVTCSILFYLICGITYVQCLRNPLDQPINCSAIIDMYTPQHLRKTNHWDVICKNPTFGKCYLVFKELFDHNSAVDNCHNKGAKIVRPESKKESEFLAEIAGGDFHLPQTRRMEGEPYDFEGDESTYSNFIWFIDSYNGLCLAASTWKAVWRPIECEKKLVTICQF
ncbi:unnamed protein product [Calicophoron daubneyi]|uniref:C-type lectin domain-containing protein n=1 Tax=Calicophoron daubneyi TaxID=300641 RepID=A0AAV2T5Z2_CALDB